MEMCKTNFNAFSIAMAVNKMDSCEDILEPLTYVRARDIWPDSAIKWLHQYYKINKQRGNV